MGARLLELADTGVLRVGCIPELGARLPKQWSGARLPEPQFWIVQFCGSVYVNWHAQLQQSGLHENQQALEVGWVPMDLSILLHTKSECIWVGPSKLNQIRLFVLDGLRQTCQVLARG